MDSDLPRNLSTECRGHRRYLSSHFRWQQLLFALRLKNYVSPFSSFCVRLSSLLSIPLSICRCETHRKWLFPEHPRPSQNVCLQEDGGQISHFRWRSFDSSVTTCKCILFHCTTPHMQKSPPRFVLNGILL